MNSYLLALIGVVTFYVVGFVIYRLMYRAALAGEPATKSPVALIKAVLSFYLIALGFVILYDATIFTSGLIGPAKGVFLGVLVGLVAFVLPFTVDAAHLRSANPTAIKAMSVNWLVSFIIFGLVVGLLS